MQSSKYVYLASKSQMNNEFDFKKLLYIKEFSINLERTIVWQQ